MRLPPLDVLISWPRPNYVDPVTRSTALLVTNGIFVSGMVLAVGLRFYSRIKVKNWYGVDDGFIAVATVFAVALCVVVIIGNEMFCWDRHTWDVPWNKIKGAMIIAFVAKIAFTLAATTTRISLLCLYYRLVQDSGIRWFRWALHLTLAYLVAICVMFVFLVIFGCVPVEAYWNFPPNNSARCLNEGTITVTAGVLNCVSDFLVATLPIPIVMRLRMPLRQRVGVCILLSLGYVVTVAGIVRTYFIYKSLVATYDETWYSYPLWIAATVEIDLAVVSDGFPKGCSATSPDHDMSLDLRVCSSNPHTSQTEAV
ncbi:hypothetical protein K431DRAFT_63989 [Polychaeton citri CBS 116435]|uniref:Rhodopsin domain-containing protein n=1 Tax=Polychaeton citri CBS 116435 TaxID=1314669 RepID=A0A9P4UR79_9PEZI|nr:hypothetical protein K431DRAFT_63989 [Polychaeton citri CBS 116435]